MEYEIGDKQFIDLLNKAQNYSLNDQRGKIDSKNLEIPNFLLTNTNLVKSHHQSLSQSIICNQSLNSNYHSYRINDPCFNNDNNSHNNSQNNHNRSLILPLTSSTSMSSLPIINYQTLSSSGSVSNTINQNYMSASRSRSPIVIVYDYEDLDCVANNNGSIIYEESKSYTINQFKSPSSVANLSFNYHQRNNYNPSLNSSLKNRINNSMISCNSNKLSDIDELSQVKQVNQQQTPSKVKSNTSSLNNSQISYV